MTTDQDRQGAVRTRVEGAATPGSLVTTDEVWSQLAKASFAVISQVSAAGEPRSSGVLCKVADHRLFVATAPDSWKAKQLSARDRVAVTVPVRRGGLLSLIMPIPPATISFHGRAIVHPTGAFPVPDALGSLLPEDRRADNRIIEIVPEGEFVTYGVGVRLMDMRTPALSRGRAPVATAG